MPGYTLLPVDYQPDFDHYTLIPVDYDPFAADGPIRQARRQRAGDRQQPRRIGWRGQQRRCRRWSESDFGPGRIIRACSLWRLCQSEANGVACQ